MGESGDTSQEHTALTPRARPSDDGSMRWITRLFRRGNAKASVDGRDARRIVEAYAACLERAVPGRRHRAERELPYSKETIGRAILLALRYSSGPETTEPLADGFVDLERFLNEEEWPVVEEYETRLRSPEVPTALDAMAPARRDTAVRILGEVEARRARRRRLLEILDAERAGDGQPKE
jgi:hypothetical protein